MSFDAVIQQNGWGTGLGRCSVQVAFIERGLSDGMGEHPAQPWEPLAMPEGDGDCAVTLRDIEEMKEILAEQGMPEDNWNIDGRIDVGSRVLLESAEGTVELLPVRDPDGVLQHYAMSGCDEQTFPFRRAFDLVVPEGSVEIPAFRIDDALGTGPQMALTGLGSLTEIGSGTVQQSADFPIAWSFDGDVATIDMPLQHQLWVTLRNNAPDDNIQEFEAMLCLADPPDDSLPTQFSLPAADLQQLTPNPAPGSPYRIGLQLDSRTTGPELTMPWGQRIRVQSTVSIDGDGELL